MEEKLSVEVLINKMDLLQHLETAKKSVTSRICLDDFFAIDDNEYTLLESELNELYPDFTFKVVPVFSGFALDLLITNKAKKRYDAILKTKLIMTCIDFFMRNTEFIVRDLLQKI